MVRALRGTPGVVTIVILFATAGCSSALAVNSGPLANGQARGQLCQPTTLGAPITYGITAFRNSGSLTAIITKVALFEPIQLRVLGTSVLSMDEVPKTYLVGDDAGYPPPPILLRQPGVGRAWAQRQRAPGAKLPPSPRNQPSQTYNLVLGLVVTNSLVGSARGIDIFYTVGGKPYLERTGISLRYPVAPKRC